MEKYVNKIKSALNAAFQKKLSNINPITLTSGYRLTISKVGEVLVTDFSELKLMDFIGGRKFEVDGEGYASILEKSGEGEVQKYVGFSFKEASVEFNDASQSFDVLTLGEFIPSGFVNKTVI